MAVVNAANTGNWSSSSTWPGGTFPTASDDVYANGKTVTIDQDITALSLRTTAGPGGVVGGGFVLNSGRIVNANIIPGTTTCVTFIYVSPLSSTINGTVVGSSTTSAARGVSSTSTGALVVNGNVTGGASGVALWVTGNITVTGNLASGTASAIDVQGAGSRDINITGDLVGGILSGSVINFNTGSGNLTINGNINGSTENGWNGVFCQNPYVIVLNGNITMGAGGTTSVQSNGIRINASTTVTVNGNVTGGANTASCGIVPIGGNSTITINGNVTGGTNCAALVTTTVASNFIINGGVYSSAASPAIITDAGSVTAKGPFVSSTTGVFPFACKNFKLIRTNDSENYFQISNGTTLYRFDGPDHATDLPFEEDVREGTAFGGALVGTLAVPDPSHVSVGIPTDDTVGTGVLTIAEVATSVWNFPRSAATTPDSMGVRLKDNATVESTGEQIAAI